MTQQTQDRIRADAIKATDKEDERVRDKFSDYGRRISFVHGYENGYISGATTECEQAEDAIKLLKEAQVLLTSEREKAWELVKALEWIKTYGPIDNLTKVFIDTALKQWKIKNTTQELRIASNYSTD